MYLGCCCCRCCCCCFAAVGLLQQQEDPRIAELLAAAAERRDKATCVKGGKQRALLAMAERLEADARALAAAGKQLEQQHKQQNMPAAGDFGHDGAGSVCSEASYSSQV